MKIREAHALMMQAIEVRGLQDGIAMRRQIAVTLIVGEDENDVRAFLSEGSGRGERDQRKNGEDGQENGCCRRVDAVLFHCASRLSMRRRIRATRKSGSGGARLCRALRQAQGKLPRQIQGKPAGVRTGSTESRPTE